MNTKSVALAVLVAAGVALLSAPPSQAKDTDVYLKSAGSSSTEDAPNVLIILDNSGSMSGLVTKAASYDKATTYTYEGPGTAFDTDKIYWINGSQGRPNSADTYPGQWFSVSNNHCKSSSVPNAYGTNDNGSYNVRAVNWQSGSGWSGLRKEDLRVDCSADSPADVTGTYVRDSKTTQYTNNNNLKISWTSDMAVTMYSGNYLNFKTNANAVSKSKMDVAKEVINNLIDSNPDVRIGLMSFNDNSTWADGVQDSGGRVVFPVSNMDDTSRASLHTIVDSYSAKTWTPLTETMYEAYLYLKGEAPRYGNSTNPTNPVAAAAAQQDGKYVSPIKYACQKTYIILVTDGDPTLDESADALIDALPDIGTPGIVDHYAAGTAANSNYATTNHKSRLAVLAGYMFDNDLRSDLSDKQNVVTFTVGFDPSTTAAGINQAGLDLLDKTAELGGGDFKTAADAEELNNALQAALMAIQTQTASFTAPALSVNAFNTLFNRDDVYYAMFQPDGKRRWDGNIKKYSLCKKTTTQCTFGEIVDTNGNRAIDANYTITGTAVSYWNTTQDGNTVNKGGAGAKLPASTSRTVYTYTGAYATDNIEPAGGGPVALSAVDTTNAALTAAMLGAPDATTRDKLINWILGKDAFKEYGADDTAERPWRFYDPMHSRPVIVNYGGTSAAPVMKIFVGTNDGMIRMINESTGVEEWAFLPKELLSQISTIAPNGFGEHFWGIDGTPYVDVYDKDGDGVIEPGDDYVHLYIGMRRGGSNIYALDVTPSEALTVPGNVGKVTPKLKWVIRGGISTGYGSLGETWSRPMIAKIRSGTGNKSADNLDESQTKKVLFFAGGYDPAADTVIPAPTTTKGNAIFIADPASGERIFWASANSGADLALTGMKYSIPSDLTLMDANGDGAVDRIYVGDVGGQVWRLDLSPTLRAGNPGGSSGHVLADLACTAGTRPACTGTTYQDHRRFFFPPDVAQVDDSIFSSTAKYDIVTIASGDREDPLDLLTTNQSPRPEDAVENRLYALRDTVIKSMETGGSISYPATIKEADLYDATANGLQGATTAVITTSGIKDDKGWYINFTSEGEKSLARTSIFGGTLFATTYLPNDGTTTTGACTPSIGTGTLYAINILDATAATDLTGDGGALTTADRTTSVGAGIPSEHVVIIRPEGNSDLVGTATPGAVKQQLQRDKTYWFQ